MKCRKFDNTDSLHADLVEHIWTGSYLLKNYGAHFRKSMRILCKKIIRVGNDWVGDSVWGSPVIPVAPPS